jgi:hypothetical protein
MFLQNTANTALSMDEAISPSINCSNLNGATLKFKVAYAQKNASQLDFLKVYSSTNCGQSWTQRYSKSGQTLQTLGSGIYQSTAFTPSSTQWRQESININNLWFSPNVIFKFVFVCDSTTSGNNIYIDDININLTTTGMQEDLDNNLDFYVAPNPSNGNAFVNFTLMNKSNVQLEVIDLLGRKLESISNAKMDAGDYKLPIGSAHNYSSGIYFVNLKVDGKVFTKKMVIE